MDPKNRKYIAILSQASTGAPSEVAVLQNDFGEVSLSRSGQGVYEITCSKFFNGNKTVVFVTHNSIMSSTYRIINAGVNANDNSTYKITVEAVDADGSAQDGFTQLQIMIIEFQDVKE